MIALNWSAESHRLLMTVCPMASQLSCLLHVVSSALVILLMVPHRSGIFSVAADTTLGESITVAQCRSSCLLKFTGEPDRDDKCRRNADCYMCWNSCRLLIGDLPARSSLCADPTACFPGCQTACNFYQMIPPRNRTPPILDDLPPSLPAYLPPPKLTLQGRITWGPPIWPQVATKLPSNHDLIMYLVMIEVGGRWTQLTQTSSPSSLLPVQTTTYPRVRIVAVSSEGPVASSEVDLNLPTELEVKTPRPPELLSPNDDHDQMSAPLQLSLPPSTGPSLKTASQAKDASTKPELPNEPDPEPPSITMDRLWQVEVKPKSLGLLATVEVTWETRGADQVDYLVSWIESSGGLSGHLLSPHPCAEITLLPGQEYVVQVELLDHHGNPVLRSVPNQVTFLTTTTKVNPFTSPTPQQSSSSTSTPSTKSSTYNYDYSVSKIVKEHFGVGRDIAFQHKYHEIKPDFSSNYMFSGNRYDHYDGPQEQWYLPETTTPFQDTNHIQAFSPPHSQNFLDPDSVSSEESYFENKSSKEITSFWVGGLVVGVIIIIVVLVLTVRMRWRKSTQSDCPSSEDYLSETTASSSIPTPQRATSSMSEQCQPEGNSWNLERFYFASEKPSGKIAYYRPPPPPPPRPSMPIDSASLVENYILSLHPSAKVGGY